MISLVWRLLIISRTDSWKLKLIVSCLFGWDEGAEMMIIYTITIQSELNPRKGVNLQRSYFIFVLFH